MKSCPAVLLLLMNAYFGNAQAVLVAEQAANIALQKTADKLNSLNNLSYDLSRELNYASENFRHISGWSCYFDFNGSNTVGFQYQVQDSGSTNIFNGTEKFELDNRSKRIIINSSPEMKDFQSLSFLYNSILTLRNILPLLIADTHSLKTSKDTLIQDQPFEIVAINIGKRRIQNLGNAFDNMQTKSDFIYKIMIDKTSSLPVEVLQQNDLNGDFIKTKFLNIHPSPKPPGEYSWYYSTYMPDYTMPEAKEITPLIPVGSKATDWSLPLYNKNENRSLAELRGKVILLDFWFKNCGPCIESIPHLNAINKKFRDRNFEMFGINTWDSKKDIAWFCNKHQVDYAVLMNGENVADKYGVSAFPTIILIDKEGKVLYTGGLNQPAIEALIEKAL